MVSQAKVEAKLLLTDYKKIASSRYKKNSTLSSFDCDFAHDVIDQ